MIGDSHVCKHNVLQMFFLCFVLLDCSSLKCMCFPLKEQCPTVNQLYSGPKSSMCWRVMYEIPVVKSRLRVMVRIKNNVCSQKIVSIKSAKKIYTEL